VTPLADGTTGGSEIYRIEADGEPHLLWSSAREIVYSLAVDAKGALYAATGNEGRIYRIDSATESTRIADLEAPQATSLVAQPSGALLVATANPGQLHQFGPALAAEGTVESDAFDAKAFTYWGRMSALSSQRRQHHNQTRSGRGRRKFWAERFRRSLPRLRPATGWATAGTPTGIPRCRRRGRLSTEERRTRWDHSRNDLRLQILRRSASLTCLHQSLPPSGTPDDRHRQTPHRGRRH
jgi:hypothetical protein